MSSAMAATISISARRSARDAFQLLTCKPMTTPCELTDVAAGWLDSANSTLDPGRLEQELVLAFHKLDVDEEIDRLGVHIAEVRSRLDSPEPIGRRLDFLMQEFNRESNTLGSKSIDTRTTQS